MAVTTTTRLGCGRDVDDVWEHMDRPPDGHEEACPYCTAARADLAELSAATRRLAAADREDSTLRVPDGMLSDVLSIVRTQVRRGRTIPLLRPVPAGHDGAGDEAPDLTVSEQLVATLVREVCDLDPDVEVRRVGIDATATPVPATVTAGGAPGGIEPADLSIDLQVTVRHDVAIPDLLDGLRRTIRSQVLTRVGTTVSRIDVAVVDLFDV
jgi:hypothetical protein